MRIRRSVLVAVLAALLVVGQAIAPAASAASANAIQRQDAPWW